jgi:transposase InsO family protein
MRPEVLFECHDSILSGHLGCKKTIEKIRQRYYWFGMKEDVHLHIKQCDVCGADKKPHKTPRAPMGTLVTGAPMDVVATDYLGPFPVSEQGNRYILVLTDHFSKYVEVLAVPDQTAETCANKVLNEFIARWGCPLSIHSDLGRSYESRVFKELCRLMEIRKTRTSPRNPRGNGQVERFNRTLVQMIKAYLCGQQEQWDRNLGCLAGAYRATPNESTGLTPNLLTIGREVRLPSEVLYGSAVEAKNQNVTSYCEYVDTLKTQMQRAHYVARKHLGVAAKRHKAVYDAKISIYKYQVGDIVWCLNESRRVGVMPKLERTYEGPFMIKRKITEVNFTLQVDKAGTEKLVHHNKLKPYEGVNPLKGIQRAKQKILAVPWILEEVRLY